MRRVAISELPAVLHPLRKSWPVLILMPLMPLVHRRNAAGGDAGVGAERGTGRSKRRVQEPRLPNQNSAVCLRKTRGKRKEWCLIQVGLPTGITIVDKGITPFPRSNSSAKACPRCESKQICGSLINHLLFAPVWRALTEKLG